jgi:hypothetical protein
MNRAARFLKKRAMDAAWNFETQRAFVIGAIEFLEFGGRQVEKCCDSLDVVDSEKDIAGGLAAVGAAGLAFKAEVDFANLDEVGHPASLVSRNGGRKTKIAKLLGDQISKTLTWVSISSRGSNDDQ